MAAPEFDVVVIGAGPGGYVAAIRAAQHGLKVACIEKRDRLGGTCLNVGCIPSKALLHGSEFYAEAHSGALAKFGVKLGSVELDLPALLGEKDKAVKELTDGIAFLFKKNKVEWIKGEASFIDAKSLKVDDRVLTAKNFIIATGSEVALLPGMAPDGEVIVTSTEALSFAQVPGHLVIIGGGYIGLEMGSVWRRLGARVTVVEYAERIVPAMDIEVADAFAKILARQGFEFHTSTKVTGVRRDGAGAVVTVEPAAGGAATEIAADTVLLSIGRRPNTDGLNIAATGLALDRGRVIVGRDFSTPVPGIWAIGDVIPGPMLAHKAEDEGIACADNIAGLTGYVNHDVIPAVVYTQPEVATVGKTEEELQAAGIEYKAGKFPFAANSRAKTNRDTDGFVKVLADARTDRVLGVHIIGSMAGTMIAEAAIAMEFGASSEDIAMTCHAHPTHTEALKEAAMAVTGKPIHVIAPPAFEAVRPLLSWLDMAGVAVFAISGALAAARAKQTIVTFAFFAAITGIGGGTLRDLLIGAPVFWVGRSDYLGICLVAAGAVWVLRADRWQLPALLWFDAIGMAAYAVIGAAKAGSYGLPPLPCIVMGVLTASFGGIVRDVLAGVPSILLRREIYVSAAALGAGTYVLLAELGMVNILAGIIGAAAGFTLRALAIGRGLALPAYRDN